MALIRPWVIFFCFIWGGAFSYAKDNTETVVENKGGVENGWRLHEKQNCGRNYVCLCNARYAYASPPMNTLFAVDPAGGVLNLCQSDFCTRRFHCLGCSKFDLPPAKGPN